MPINFEHQMEGDALGQSADGKPHMAYYINSYQLSFIWDGFSGQASVAFGGYGEHPFASFPIIDENADLVGFKAACDGWFADNIEDLNLALEAQRSS